MPMESGSKIYSSSTVSVDAQTTTITIPVTLHYSKPLTPEQIEAEAARMQRLLAMQFPVVELRRLRHN